MRLTLSRFRRGPGHPDLVACEVVADCWQTMAELITEQAGIFVDLGQTAAEREHLADLVASSLSESGLIATEAKQLHRLLLPDDLFFLVFSYLCQRPKAQVEHDLATRLAKRPEYSPYVTQSPRSDELGTRTHAEPFDAIATGRYATVPQLPTDAGAHRARSRANRDERSGRDPRRTQFCDTRPMPVVPARVLGRDPRPDLAKSATLESGRDRRIHKTTLVTHADNPIMPGYPPS